jgi:WD40 repeat protein
MSQHDDHKDLELCGVIGFNGSIHNGLILHPADQHMIYPLGTTIVIKHLLSNSQTFLQRNGHESSVSCMNLSSSGKYLASGEETNMGFTATGIIWDIETYEILFKLNLHKGKIQALAFSPDEKFLATLGGRDDNKLVIWDVQTGEPICGSTAAQETTLTLRWLNNRSDCLVTGGNYTLRVWDFDLGNRKLRPQDCHLGQLRRVITDITIDDDDSMLYASTKSGDILQVSLGPKLFKGRGPKTAFPCGINCIVTTARGNFVVGAGDGTVALLMKGSYRRVRSLQLEGAITSIALNAAGDHIFVGTALCNIFCVSLASFEYELRSTCHSNIIFDIAYPRDYSKLFATCSVGNIRVWHADTRNELLRIQVPNMTCLSVCFMPDGKSIVSGWDDGKIRAFRPRTGTLMYTINDAHRGGVTSLACTADCQRIISGGKGGMVRVWAIGRQTQRMIASMKEHKATVNSVSVNDDDTQCVSASSDGSCIVWSLERFSRIQCFFENTQFKDAQYHPDQTQLLTTGTDRKITFWDAADGNPIRIIDGSRTDMLNCLAISSDGAKFVSGGGEKLVQVYNYDEGKQYFVGHGHSGSIIRTKISPDQQTIVTVGDEGAIFMWRMPDMGMGMQPAYDPSDGPIPAYSEPPQQDYPSPTRGSRQGSRQSGRPSSRPNSNRMKTSYIPAFDG